ncbi:MAG: peptide deformylase [Saprospiraceae bacterium]|nr:peptide deformylase [Saprospiraceae bacterium]MBP7699815.1 peptide deformylase [Saprospiraceae bacterium]
MILPIYLYGHPVLKKVAQPIDSEYTNLEELIKNMWETMYAAKGVGLAAPQIGQSIRLFLIDTEQLDDEDRINSKPIKMAFINAQKIEETGDLYNYEEGCLSIPHIRGEVERPTTIRLRYMDVNFNEHETVFEGLNARVIQHEYDHLEGILFTEKLKPIKRSLIQRKLESIRKGKVDADYKIHRS